MWTRCCHGCSRHHCCCHLHDHWVVSAEHVTMSQEYIRFHGKAHWLFSISRLKGKWQIYAKSASCKGISSKDLHGWWVAPTWIQVVSFKSAWNSPLLVLWPLHFQDWNLLKCDDLQETIRKSEEEDAKAGRCCWCVQSCSWTTTPKNGTTRTQLFHKVCVLFLDPALFQQPCTLGAHASPHTMRNCSFKNIDGKQSFDRTKSTVILLIISIMVNIVCCCKQIVNHIWICLRFTKKSPTISHSVLLAHWHIEGHARLSC